MNLISCPFLLAAEGGGRGGGWFDLVYGTGKVVSFSISKAKTIQLKGSQVFRKSSFC